MAIARSVVLTIVGRDKASGAFLSASKAAESAAYATDRAVIRMGARMASLQAVGQKMSKSITLPVVAAASTAVFEAAKFQKSMTLIETATGELHSNMTVVSKGVLSISKSTGTGLNSLGEGMYMVEKAGFRGAAGITVLKAAAQGAKAENVGLATATSALTSIMTSYHMSAGQAVQAENMLIRGSGLAKTTMTDFASSLSNIVPLASALGISFPQVAGAIDTMTQHGETAQRATENLANLVTNLAGQNGVASGSMQQLGIHTLDLQKHLGERGISGTLQIVMDRLAASSKGGMVVVSSFRQAALATSSLNTMMGGMDPVTKKASDALLKGSMNIDQYRKFAKGMGGQAGASALQFLSLYKSVYGFSQLLKSGRGDTATAAKQLQNMLGGVTGLKTALMLTGGSAKLFTNNIDAVAAAGKLAGADVLGWAKTHDTLSNKIDRAKASLMVMAVEIGTALIPAVSKLVGWVSKAVDWFNGLSTGDKKFIGWSIVVLAALGPVLAIFGRLGKLLVLGGKLAVWRAGMLGVSTTTAQTATRVAEAEAAQTRAVVAGTETQIAAIEALRKIAMTPVVMGPVVGGGVGGIGGRGVLPIGGVGGRPIGAPIGSGRGVGVIPLLGTGARRTGILSRGRGMGGMLLGTALAVGGPMIGSAVGGKKGSARNIAGTIGADAATGAGYGLMVGGAPGALVFGLVGAGIGLHSAIPSKKPLTQAQLDKIGLTPHVGSPTRAGGIGSAAIDLRNKARADEASGSKPKAPKLTADQLGLSKLALDTSVAGLNRLNHAEQEVALRNSVLGKSMQALSGNVISPDSAAKSFGHTLHDLAGQTKNSKAGLDGMTNASKTNRAYVIAAMTAAEQHAESLTKSGASAKVVEGALLKDVAALEKTAIKAGFNKKSFEGMLKTMGLTPKQIHTVMDTKTDKAKVKITELQAQIAAIRQGKVPALRADPTEAAAVIAGLQDQIDALHGVIVPVYIQTSNIALGGPNSSNLGAAVPHAAGGAVTDGWFTVGERGWELAHKSGSTVKVFDNKTSQKMTRRNRVPGYATGTAGSSAQADRAIDLSKPITPAAALAAALGKDAAATKAKTAADKAAAAAEKRANLINSDRDAIAAFLVAARSTTASADELASAAKSLVDAARETKVSAGEQSRLVRDSAILAKLSAARDAISARLGSAPTAPTAYDRLGTAQGAYNDSKDTTRQAVMGSFDVTTAGQNSWGVSTTQGILGAITKAAANAGRFATLVKRLAKEGLNRHLIEQLTAAGPSALGAAEALAKATPAQLRTINSSYKSITNTGYSLGKAVADDFYLAGVKSAEAIVKGLLTKRSLLNKTITGLGYAMVISLQNAIGVKAGVVAKPQLTAAEKKIEQNFHIYGITDPEALAIALARRLSKLVA